MGKGKANKKTYQNKHKDAENESHKTTTDKKRGKHGNISTTRNNMVHHEVIVDEKFRKRKLESNWEKYDKDEEDGESSNEEEISNETKSLEYIKQNAGGHTSHFQFQEERELKEELENENFLIKSIYSDLNLHGLVQDTSTCSISEKLDLEAMPESCRYCIQRMNDDEKKQKVQRIQEPKTTSVDLSDVEKYDYDFTGIENLQYSLFKKLNAFKEAGSKTSASKELITYDMASSVDKGNHFDYQRVTGTYESSINGEIQENKENGMLEYLLNSGNEDIEDKDALQKSDLQIKSGLDIENCESLKTTCTEHKDDLDELLETPTETDHLQQLYHKVETSTEKNDDLDDWLDEMLK